MIDAAAVFFLVIGVGFFLVGTVGILRMPDLLSRLHALTKADTVGLGFVVIGLCLLAGDAAMIVKLVLVWGLALVSAATVAQLIAARAGNDTAKDEARRNDPSRGRN